MANLSCPRNWPLGKDFLPISNEILGCTDRLTLPTSPKVLYATAGLASGVLNDTNWRHPHKSKPSWWRSVNPARRLGWMEQEDLNLERSFAKCMVVHYLEKESTWNEAAPKGKVGSMESHRRCLAQHVGVFGQRAPSTVALLPCPPTAGHLGRDWNSPVPKIAQCLRSLAAWRLHVAHGTT